MQIIVRSWRKLYLYLAYAKLILNSHRDVIFATNYETRFHWDVSRAYAVFQFVIYYHLSIIYIYLYYNIQHDLFKHTRKRKLSKGMTYARSALVVLFAFKINVQSSSLLSLKFSESRSAFFKHMLIKSQSSATIISSDRKRKIKPCSEYAWNMLIVRDQHRASHMSVM